MFNAKRLAGTADRRGFEVLVVTSEGVTRHALPAAGTVRIGRADGCDLRLDDPSVSRNHAALHIEREITIEDLGGSNGTALRKATRTRGNAETENLIQLRRERASVTVGDRIVLGTMQLVLVKAEASQGGAGEPRAADQRMTELYAQAERAAKSPISVLIHGETGAGKDVLARFVHTRSPRSASPFLAINCAALPENLLEAELFGSEKGAFTGAAQARAGLLESAEHGTVFLDEVGELPLPTQAKLLRVVEDRKVLRVGGRTARVIDVRFVAATNRDLEQLSQAKLFREDLYFRLNGMTLTVPPLRERVAEIKPLAVKFLDMACEAVGLSSLEFAPQTLTMLERYRWPGNVRELKNVIERAALFCDGKTILPEHLTDQVRAVGSATEQRRAEHGKQIAPVPEPDSIQGELERIRSEQRELERERIRRALDECGGNQKRAAELLGISRRTLVNKLNQLELPRPRK